MPSRVSHTSVHQETFTDKDPVAPRVQQGSCVAPDADELALFLQLVDHDDEYRIEEVLKESDFEITQKVLFVSDSGKEEGPYIRKYLKQAYGLGGMYEEIYRAQQAGRHFTYLPQIHECYHLKDDLVVVMEYVQGETLQEVVYRLDPSVDLAFSLFPLIVRATQELHWSFDPPIIHRDLKPSNIIVSFNRLTLIDFGIARSYSHGSETDTVHFGTREYAPPEQFGYGQTDVRSDIYALGMLLYYCLTEKTADAKVRAREFASPGVPEPLRQIIASACAFDPNDRYESTEALLVAFEEARLSVARENERSVVCENESVCSLGEPSLQRAGTASAIVRLSRASASIKAISDRVPFAVGVAWNTILLLVWLMLIMGSCVAVFNPNEYDQQFPLWFRILEYGGFAGIMFTSWCYVFLDKRRFFKKFPRTKRTTFPVRFTIGVIAIPFVLFMVVVLVGQFIIPNGVFAPR